MQVIHSIREMKAFARESRAAGRALALVPTMGALHEGHTSLVRKARQQCNSTVVSIFLNPTQFSPGEDLDRYPRNLDNDLQILRSLSVSAAFVPDLEEIYPPGFEATVDPGPVSTRLEGLSRPQHFRGVATIVLKLFNIVGPDMAYFGQKDFQQTVVIRQLIRDFNLDVRLVVCPTVRDPDGVAISSRNAYLSPQERQPAQLLNRSLKRVRELAWRGETSAGELVREMRQVLESDPRVALDYVMIVDGNFLNPVDRACAGCVALVAARIGSTRLIDNTIFGPFEATEEQLLEIGGQSHAGSGLEPQSLRVSV